MVRYCCIRTAGQNVEDMLKKYPCLFVALPAAGVDKEHVSVDKVKDEDFEDINLKESRTQNVVSYAYYVTGNADKALEIADNVLRQHPSNVIALTNKAWLLLKQDKTTEAIDVCKILESTDNVDLLIARGELAFAYAMFGLKTYELAVKEYEDLLKGWKRNIVPDEYFCMWSFGLFLLLHRKRKDSKSFTETDEDSEKRLQLLLEVTKIHTRNDVVKLYQARCYANICRINYDQVCRRYTGKDKYQQLRRTPLEAMERAHDLGYNDVYTLDLIVKYMMYYHEKVHQAMKCLERSIKLRETSKGYHRLAKTQKRELESRIFKTFPRRTPEPNYQIISLMKCPRKPTVSLTSYKNQPLMSEVLNNIAKAVKIDPKNMDAYYDYGLTYRQLNEHKKALEKFEHILQFKEGPRTLLQVANSYEQSGYCMMDMINEGELPQEERERLKNKINTMFIRSVESSCSLLRNVPSLDTLWSGNPTLLDMLNHEAKTIRDVSELSFLEVRMTSLANLNILAKLKEVDGQLEANDRRIRALINGLVAEVKYDEACSVMVMITCLPNGWKALEVKTYTDCYIRAGLIAYMGGEALLARLRIVNALTFQKNQSASFEMKHDIIDEDLANLQGTEVILIYQNKSLKYTSQALKEIFQDVGVKIHAHPPSRRLECGSDKSVMRSYMVLVGDNKPEHNDGANLEEAMDNLSINNFDTNVDLIFEDLDSRAYGNLLVVTCTADTDIPKALRDFTTITFNADKERQPGALDDEDRDFVTDALIGMATF